jgi:micrococcal nuclease
MLRRLAALLVAAALVVLGVAEGPGLLDDGDQDRATTGARETRVQRVVDGDTFVLPSDERVRLIGVDTPESVKPGTPVECFARKAGALTERLLEGRRVRLAFDVERRDRYGRLLAYVTRVSDGLDVNAELLRRGYARTLTVPPNVRNADRYARLQRRARAAGRGLWSACR